MRTEQGDKGGSAVFLFAHQDDEFGVFQSIERERAQGARILVAYLTTGVPAGGCPDIRNEESLRVLAGLGIPAANVRFAGSMLAIADGALSSHLPDAVAWLSDWLGTMQDVRRLYVPAWEGGHPDHDSLHAAALMAAANSSAPLTTRQYPLYNAYRRPGPLFRVMYPLPQNGPVERVPIPFGNRLRFVRNCLAYPSQARSWLGLFPFAAFHYLAVGAELLQAVSPARLQQRPHAGDLYYERRRFSTWDKVSGAINDCLRLHPTAGTLQASP